MLLGTFHINIYVGLYLSKYKDDLLLVGGKGYAFCIFPLILFWNLQAEDALNKSQWFD